MDEELDPALDEPATLACGPHSCCGRRPGGGAPLVGTDLGVMDRDARRMRGEHAFLFANLKEGLGVAEIHSFVERTGDLHA